MTIFGLVWSLALGACSSEGSVSSTTEEEPVVEKIHEEVEDPNGELPLVTAFSDTQFAHDLAENYDFRIVEGMEMNEGRTAWMLARSNFAYQETQPLGAGHHDFRLAVDGDELLIQLISFHNTIIDFEETQTRNLGTVDPDSVSDLSFLENDDLLSEIGQFLRDNLYERFGPETVRYEVFHYAFAVRRFFYDDGYTNPILLRGPIDLALYESEETLGVNIDNDVMTITSDSSDDSVVFNRLDSTVKDGEGNLIAHGYRIDAEDIYDGQIGFASDEDIEAIIGAFEDLAAESAEEEPSW